ncbi:MAG: h16, partial [Rhizobacter sp.]|nr:h16 [Rhizobacter sp.]
AGLGLGQGTSILFDQDIRAGRLERVLAPFEAEGQTLWAVYPQAKGRNLKVKAFVHFLEQIFATGAKAPIVREASSEARHAHELGTPSP